MKLHLPKVLLTAVLAAVCVTGTPLFALEVTKTDNSTTVTSGNWTKTYASVHEPASNSDFPKAKVDATLIYQNNQRLGYDGISFSSMPNCGDIVVGGGGQLFLQTWTQGKIDINNNLYLGTSSHTDANDHGALRLGAHTGTIDIRGNVTLIEDTSLWQEANGHTVTIHGTTTGDYTLTAILSNDLVFAGNVDIGGLSLRESNRITFAGNNSSIDKVSGDGPLALVIADGATLEFNSGSVHLSSLNSSGTFRVNCAVTLDSYEYIASTNGYTLTEMVILNAGTLEFGSGATINDIAGSKFTLKNGAYTAAVDDERTDTMYHVVSGTVNVADVATNISDSHKGFIVYSGATLDAAGTKSVKQHIELRQNATLANSGGNVANESGLDQEQIKKLVLKGDASVNTTGNLGVIGQGYAQTELDLAGHKLTKTGTGLFAVANADISAGIIDIQQGEFKLADKSNQSSALDVNDNVKVNVASGATLSLFSDRAAADKSWNFLRNATGTGIINIDMSEGSAVVIDGTTEEEATKIAFAGTINMSSDTTLALGAGHKNNDGYAHAGWALNMSQTTIALNGGGLRFCGNDTTIGTLDVNSNDTLLYHDSSNNPDQAVNANEGLVINTLNLDANLSITKKWKGWLDVKLLQGSGDLNIQTGSGEVSIKIHASADDYSGIISTTANSVLNLGSDSTVVHTRKAINNQGTLNIGNLSVAIDELDTRITGDDSTTGAQECSTVYTFITGNGTVNKNNGNISFTLNGTDVKGSLTADNKEFIYGPTWRYNIAANDSVQAATALQASYNEHAVGAVNVLGTMQGTSDEAWENATDVAVTGNGVIQVTGLLEDQVAKLNGFTGTVKIDGSGEAAGRVHLGSNPNLLSNTTIEVTGARGLASNGGSNEGYITGWGATFNQRIILNSGAVNADKDSTWNNISVEGSSAEDVSYLAILNSGTAIGGTMMLNGGTLKLQNAGTYTLQMKGEVRFNGGILDLNGTTMLDFEDKSTLQVVRDSTGHIKNGTINVSTFDMRGGGDKLYGGTLSLTNAHLIVNGTNWSYGNGSGILLNDNSSVTHGGTIISNRGETQGSIIVGEKDMSGDLNPSTFIAKDYVTISNADVDVTTYGETTVYAKLASSSISKSTEGTAILTNAGNSLTGVHATGGNITLQNVQKSLSLDALEIASGKAVNVGFAEDVAKKEVSVSTTATLLNGASLNTSLTLMEGATLDMNGTVNINGALSITGALTMGDKLSAVLAEMASWETPELVLFTGVSSFNGGTSATEAELASNYFTGASNNYYVEYRVDNNVGSIVVISHIDAVPEPTTATLSLLALAGLCARRRRRA